MLTTGAKMQGRNFEIITDVVKDVDSSKFLAAIEKNDTERLQRLMDYALFHEISKIIDGLQMAIELKKWDCLKILIKYIAQSQLHDSTLMAKCGEVLILAAKNNKTNLIKACTHLNYSDGKQNIFYQKSNDLFSQKIFFHDYYGYTALHWAVKNNNFEACELLTQLFQNTQSRPSASNIDLYKVVNKKNQTAFDLAIHLNHIACARIIASYHYWQYVRDHSTDKVIFKILFNNIQFGIYGQYKGPIGIYHKICALDDTKSVVDINKKDL